MFVKKRSDQTDEKYEYEKFINAGVPGGITGAFIGLGILAIPGVNFTYAGAIGFVFICSIVGLFSCNAAYGSDFNNSGIQSPDPNDPIIIDLNNDGVLETTDINHGVYFDHENDGFAVCRLGFNPTITNKVCSRSGCACKLIN